MNSFQEIWTNASPELQEEINVAREETDITLDILTSSSKLEIIANMIQLGLVTPELYNKHFGEEENKETNKEKSKQ